MVTPANEIPEVVGRKRGAKLAICNLQKTPLDQHSDLRIYSKTDDFMIRVMEKLQIQIPPFILHRRLVIGLETNEEKRHQLTVYGVDVDGTPVTFLRSVKLEYNRRVARSDPFVFNFRSDLDSGMQLKLELEFMGHYGEPNLEIILEYHNDRDTQTLHLLDYNPDTGEWKASKQSGLAASDRTHDDIEKKQNAKLTPTEDSSVPDNVQPTPAANTLPDIAV
jgi:hypothetical protein